jgi:mono/diheme cytochrome c family protein
VRPGRRHGAIGDLGLGRGRLRRTSLIPWNTLTPVWLRMSAAVCACALVLSACGSSREPTATDCGPVIATNVPGGLKSTSVKHPSRGPVRCGPIVGAPAIQPPLAIQRAGGQQLAEFKAGNQVLDTNGCLDCHRIGGVGNPGPGQGLADVGSRLSPKEIERTILAPAAPMPSFRKLPPADFRALVAFLTLMRGQSAMHRTNSAPY